MDDFYYVLLAILVIIIIIQFFSKKRLRQEIKRCTSEITSLKSKIKEKVGTNPNKKNSQKDAKKTNNSTESKVSTVEEAFYSLYTVYLDICSQYWEDVGSKFDAKEFYVTGYCSYPQGDRKYAVTFLYKLVDETRYEVTVGINLGSFKNEDFDKVENMSQPIKDLLKAYAFRLDLCKFEGVPPYALALLDLQYDINDDTKEAGHNIVGAIINCRNICNKKEIVEFSSSFN